MFPLSAVQASKKIKEIIKHYDNTMNLSLGTAPGKLLALIEDVSHLDIMLLYNTLKEEKRLYMPQELDGDRITIVYMPNPRCVIQIESEPVKLITANYNKFSLN